MLWQLGVAHPTFSVVAASFAEQLSDRTGYAGLINVKTPPPYADDCRIPRLCRLLSSGPAAHNPRSPGSGSRQKRKLACDVKKLVESVEEPGDNSGGTQLGALVSGCRPARYGNTTCHAVQDK
ncbi:hypothetical protein B0T14DRAFT_207750 [Immersiella caudata]|uniref:Uncharacterized protein n=1 Tax=Immersiella caudata TaxID=314043 RepID=A0AA40BZD5_9PEZI|nr:hypothetical protein B0T14DRAFT_207750 [Immersiella caudata]